jgi:transcriptional regulator with XRE-family HTH domain
MQRYCILLYSAIVQFVILLHFFLDALFVVDTQQKQQGERLKVLRKKMGKTQVEFAQELQVTQSYVSSLEHGDRALSGGLASTIIEIYPGVNMDWLLTGRGQPLIVAKGVQSTGNLVQVIDDLVQVMPAKEAQEPATGYGEECSEVQSLRRRIKRLEQFISQKFPDFPVEEI